MFNFLYRTIARFFGYRPRCTHCGFPKHRRRNYCVCCGKR